MYHRELTKHILARYLHPLFVMTIQRQRPRSPIRWYHPAMIRRLIRCCWNRLIVAVAVRAILILYALLQFVLAKYRSE
jgi:hypothetical protein